MLVPKDVVYNIIVRTASDETMVEENYYNFCLILPTKKFHSIQEKQNLKIPKIRKYNSLSLALKSHF